MKDFLELLVKEYGFPKFMASNIMLAFYCIVGFFAIYKFLKALFVKINKSYIKKFVNKDLHPYFTSEEVIKYTRYYIPQYFQNITPSEGEELGKIHAAAARSKLMPEFIKKGLLSESPVKYFIILSDTGMGKTAFLINLYIKYKKSKSKINQIKYNIHLFPLGSNNALKKIEQIIDKKNTILLLDAFDEDIKAVHDYKSRMNEILESVKDFRKVIFTCRTQFFPSKDEEPTDTNDITFGENIKHSIQKLYLSAFDDKDIIKYLLKKYGLNLFKLITAYKLVKKCPSLMFRPMLLSYIDDLIKDKLFYTYSYEMYETLIDTWVERESLKPAILSRYHGINYSKNLMDFSRSLAINLYKERDKRQGYFITTEELRKITINKTINPDLLTIDDKTGRSLLNRNSVGQFKFAHKSILEYFLAVEMFNNSSFFKNFDFQGMDATKNFHFEMLTTFLKSLKGSLFLQDDTKPKNLSIITPIYLKKAKNIIISESTDIELKKLSGLTNLESLIFTNVSFLSFYVLYMHICFNPRLNIDSNLYENSYKIFVEEYLDIMKNIKKMIPNLNYERIIILISNCEIDKSLKTRILNYLTAGDRSSTKSYTELLALRNEILNGQSERALIINSYDNIKKIYQLSSLLPDVKVVF